MLARAAKDAAYKVLGKIKLMAQKRVQQQKNWRNRKDDSNYYGKASDF